MADTRVKIIDIQVRYQDAVEGMARYRTSIEEANEQLKGLKKELKGGQITQEQYNKQSEASRVYIRQQTEALNTLSRQVSTQLRAQREQEGSLKQLRAQLSNVTAAYDAMARAEREGAKGQQLKQHITQITGELRNAEEQTQRFYRNVGNYPKGATDSLNGIKSGFRSIGTTVMGIVAGGSVLNLGRQMIQVGRDYNDAMARVRAVTQGSTSDMKMMSEEAKRLGASTQYTAAESAGALELLTRNGLNAAQATQALEPTLRFAQANSIGLADAADILTNVTNGMGLAVGDMAHVSDSLAYSASHSATNVSELAEAMKNVAPFAAKLHVPIEEVNASLGVLADQGIKASDAGTAMRMVLLGLATSTPKQSAVFKKYGLSIDEASIKSEGLVATLKKLAESGIMKSAQSANELGMVFGRRVAPQAMALMNDVTKLDSKLLGLQNAEGTTAKMFEVSISNVSVGVKSLQSAWEALLLSIYDSNSGALVGPLEMMRDAINWLREHLSDVGDIIMALIAGLSFSKLVSSAMSSFSQIKNSAVANAEAATAATQKCQNDEMAIRRAAASQTAQLENASAAERSRIESRLVQTKRDLAAAEKATIRAKTAEIAAWERASAMTTGTAWKQGFSAATTAVKGFVTASKTAFKGFVVTAIIMLAYEAFNKLSKALGESGIGFGGLGKKVGAFVNAGIKVLVGWIKQAVNWFVHMYNSSMAFAGSLQTLRFVFQSVWVVLKKGFAQIFDSLKSISKLAYHSSALLGSLLTLDFKGAVAHWKAAWGTIGDYITGTINRAVSGAKEIGDAAHQASVDAGKQIGKGSHTTYYKGKNGKIYKSEDEAKASYEKAAGTKADATETASATGDVLSDKEKTKQQREAEKAAREAAKAKQQEVKLVADAEKAMNDLLADSAAKRRAALQQQYDAEIAALRVKLETEKNLTQKSRDAIARTINAKEQKLQQELAKLSDEELQRQVEFRVKVDESNLAAATRGSEEETALKKKKLQEQMQLDLLALKQQEDTAREGAELDLRMKQESLNAMQGNSTAEEMAQAQSEIVAAQQHIVEVSEGYAEMRANVVRKEAQDEVQAERENEEYKSQQRVLALQNRLAELQMSGQEEQDLQRNLDTIGLEVMTENEQQQLQVTRDIAAEKLAQIEQDGQQEGETEEEFNSRKLTAQQELYNADTQIKDGMLKNEQAYTNSKRALTQSVISITAAIGESNEGFAKASKMIALAQIAIDTGKAISAGISSAMSMPFPANIAAVATTVATVLANIATAISTVKSAKFARGGKVSGPGTGTSDSVPAQLSNGEFVMTAKATSMFEPLLAAMNDIGRGVTVPVAQSYQNVSNAEMIASTVTAAVSEMRPVVSVEEITSVQKRVELLNNLDNH